MVGLDTSKAVGRLVWDAFAIPDVPRHKPGTPSWTRLGVKGVILTTLPSFRKQPFLRDKDRSPPEALQIGLCAILNSIALQTVVSL